MKAIHIFDLSNPEDVSQYKEIQNFLQKRSDLWDKAQEIRSKLKYEQLTQDQMIGLLNETKALIWNLFDDE